MPTRTSQPKNITNAENDMLVTSTDWKGKSTMAHNYRMQGTCATEVTFDLEEGLLRNVQFRGGCDGNLKAVTKLLEGSPAKEAEALLAGIRCGRKRTSCPDQLSKAIASARPEED